MTWGLSGQPPLLPARPQEIDRQFSVEVDYMPLSFEWDRRKDSANVVKHGVAFEEATTVFADPLAVIFDDVAHSGGEVREIIIGHLSPGRLLLVAFTERDENLIRIISARKACPT